MLTATAVETAAKIACIGSGKRFDKGRPASMPMSAPAQNGSASSQQPGHQPGKAFGTRQDPCAARGPDDAARFIAVPTASNAAGTACASVTCAPNTSSGTASTPPPAPVRAMIRPITRPNASWMPVPGSANSEATVSIRPQFP